MNRMDNPRALIVIPTYNESGNIASLIEAISGLGLNIEVLIVDDNSPDGTGILAEKLSERYAHLRVIRRSAKGGRGSACIEGFKYALKTDVDYILEMDADFFHAPEAIAGLLSAAGKADVVIASRYIKGGMIKGRSLKRNLFSRAANLCARLMLGVPIKDYTSGFRCYRKEVLAALNLDTIRSRGFIVLGEMAYAIHKLHYTFIEIPITLVNRKQGPSNFTWQEISEACLTLARLQWSRIPV